MTTLNLFRHATDVQSFSAGEVIFAQGDPGDTMYVVQEGDVEIKMGDKLLDVVGEGGIFGEMALLDHTGRSATAVAKTNCKLVPINEKRFTFLVQQTPHFALTVMRVMADRLRRRMDE